MKSRNHSQKHSKPAKSSGVVGKRLRRISISDDSDGAASVDLESQLPEFLDLPVYDVATKCPTLKLICERESVVHHPSFNADELDSVQLELEKLLYHSITRTKQLRDALNDLNDGRMVPSSSANVPSTSAAGHRSDFSNKRSKIKFSSSSDVVVVPKRSAVMASLSPLKIKPPKLNVSLHRSEHVTTSERSALSPGSSRLYLWPQNQMPDKFINFVDTYAAPIEKDLLNRLTELANESNPSNCNDLYDLPNLGKHYSLRKADAGADHPPKSASPTKDVGGGGKSKSSTSTKLSSKIKNGETLPSSNELPLKTSSPTRSLKSGRVNNSKQKNINNISEKDKQEDQCYLGPLTERLVQALIEENAFEPCFDETDAILSHPNGATSNSATPAKILVKSLNLGNMAALERRVRKELEEQGLLDIGDSLVTLDGETKNESEDEVGNELKQRQKELHLLQSSNYEKLQSLITKCNLSIERQRLEERLKSADDHMIDLYSRYYGVAPSSRKPSTKKEKDQLWKSLKDRERTIDEIKNLNFEEPS